MTLNDTKRIGKHILAVGYQAQYCRLRSANRGNSNNAWNVNTSGNLNNNGANNSYRCAPDCSKKQEGTNPKGVSR